MDCYTYSDLLSIPQGMKEGARKWALEISYGRNGQTVTHSTPLQVRKIMSHLRLIIVLSSTLSLSGYDDAQRRNAQVQEGAEAEGPEHISWPDPRIGQQRDTETEGPVYDPGRSEDEENDQR